MFLWGHKQFLLHYFCKWKGLLGMWKACALQSLGHMPSVVCNVHVRVLYGIPVLWWALFTETTFCPSEGKQPETYSEKAAQGGHLQRSNAPKETYRKVGWQVNQGAKKLQVAHFGKQVLDSECPGSSPKLYSDNRFSRSFQSPGRSNTEHDPGTGRLCLFHLPQKKRQGLKR